MKLNPMQFYLFSGSHSLLIGLLPFFLPVMLWSEGGSLAIIAAFIAISGTGFLLTLWCWDRLRAMQLWGIMLLLSFILEVLLVVVLSYDSLRTFWGGVALLNGAYSSFYWTTQRFMFSRITSRTNTGNTFGNMQIMVTVLLKLGILVGGYLVQHKYLGVLLSLSVVISVATLFWIRQMAPVTQDQSQAENDSQPAALGFKDIVQFKDARSSRLVFLIDGPFLFLESYFWVLSLYLLSGQNAFQLGVLVIALSALLSLLFYGIKSGIDTIGPRRLYGVAVVSYAVSWLLRGAIDPTGEDWHLYSLVLIIAFSTAFFRLVFNTLFFEAANHHGSQRYLVLKSYFSQLGIALFFITLAVVLVLSSTVVVAAPATELDRMQLSLMYFLMSPFALIYGLYNTQFFKQSLDYGAAKP